MKIGKVGWSQTAESIECQAKEFGLHPMDNGKPFIVSESEKEYAPKPIGYIEQFGHSYLQHAFVLYSCTSGPCIYFPCLDVAIRGFQHSGC